jgi:hypothetical protein
METFAKIQASIDALRQDFTVASTKMAGIEERFTKIESDPDISRASANPPTEPKKSLKDLARQSHDFGDFHARTEGA